jgi:hypothetical protein
MSRPTFHVDFNELVDCDLVLLSQKDEREDSDGNFVTLIEGMRVKVWEEDFNDVGERDDLIATGVVVLNKEKGWSQHVKWCCRIDAPGIRHQSEIESRVRR